jgi:hypothetical protein
LTGEGVKSLEFTPLKLIINFLPLDGGRCEKIGSVLFHVIPAKAGIQCFQGISNLLDSGFHRGDGKKSIFSHLRGGEGNPVEMKMKFPPP